MPNSCAFYIYISTLGFLLAKPVRKGFKVELVYRTCIARDVPCYTTGIDVVLMSKKLETPGNHRVNAKP